MKEIIEKLKENRESMLTTRLTRAESGKIVTAFEQLKSCVNMYKFQLLEIETILLRTDLAHQDRSDISAVKIKLESVIQDLAKVLG